MFYKKEIVWMDAEMVKLTDGTILDENNRIEADGWKWMDESPSEVRLKLLNDITFGKSLIEEFLIDNRNLAQSFTSAQSQGMLQKFSVVKSLAEVGDVKNTKAILESFEVDVVFTAERKSKYIQLCENYILNV